MQINAAATQMLRPSQGKWYNKGSSSPTDGAERPAAAPVESGEEDR